jgi:hypothetical protein
MKGKLTNDNTPRANPGRRMILRPAAETVFSQNGNIMETYEGPAALETAGGFELFTCVGSTHFTGLEQISAVWREQVAAPAGIPD